MVRKKEAPIIYLWYGIKDLAYSSKLKDYLFTPFRPLILNFRGPTWENRWAVGFPSESHALQRSVFGRQFYLFVVGDCLAPVGDGVFRR